MAATGARAMTVTSYFGSTVVTPGGDAGAQTLAESFGSSAATFVLAIDLSPMTYGDIIEIEVRTNISGTERVHFLHTYAHAQTEPNKYTVPVSTVILTPFKYVIRQRAGPSRTFYFRLLQVDT